MPDSGLPEIEFAEVVELAREVVSQLPKPRNLWDVEVAALYCAWFSISYSDFEENQAEHIKRFSDCYLKPGKGQKKKSSIQSSASRLMAILGERFEVQNLSKNTFVREINQLVKGQPHLIPTYQNRVESFLNPSRKIELGLKRGEISDKSQFTRLSDINNLLEVIGENTIVCLHGLPGVGKTRLIRDILGLVGNDYSPIYIDSNGLEEFEQVTDRIQGFLSVSDNKTLIQELLTGDDLIIVIDSIGLLSKTFESFLNELTLNSQRSKAKIILVSRHKIRLDYDIKGIANYTLKGLSDANEIHSFIKTLKLSDPDYWLKLNDECEGNLNELIYISQFIREAFNGSVQKFLENYTSIISPSLSDFFEELSFSSLEVAIFNSLQNSENRVSGNLFDLLKQNTPSNEVFQKINILCRKGYIIRTEVDDEIVFSIPALLRNYLAQRNERDAGRE